MCEHGNTIDVDVPIPAHLSYTGEARWEVKPIDSCLADIVRALNEGGVLTETSCCGHGKFQPQVWMQDGRILFVCRREDGR